MNNNYICPQCADECVGMCAKDWEPEEDDYKPENAIKWLGVAVIAWCGFFVWLVLS